MTVDPKQERDRLILEYYRLGDENRSMAERGVGVSQRMVINDQADLVLQKYYDMLPKVQMSRCPFTTKALVMSFDPWGPDGFWWQETEIRETTEPKPPDTFRVLRGALSLNGLPPLGGRDNAHVGPNVPYVVPQVLNMPSMVLVVSRIKMLNGYIAFPLAYFSTQEPPAGSLIQTWRKQTYSYTDSDGNSWWSVPTDPWDFDLQPWVESGKIMWVAPDDPQFIVHRGSWAEFPYKDLPSKRLQQTIVQDKLFTSDLPDGSSADPFD